MQQYNFVVEEHDKPQGKHPDNMRGERTYHVSATHEMDARVKAALKHGLDASMLKVVACDNMDGRHVHIWKTRDDSYGLIDRCSICGEERA
jgi:hypothetical protein